MPHTTRDASLIATSIIVGACASCGVTAPLAPPPAAPEPAPEVIDTAKIDRALSSAITLYRADAEEGYRSICSGVRVAPNRIVTAYHCVLAGALPLEVLDLIRVIDPTFRNTSVEGLIGTHELFAYRGDEDAQEAIVVGIDPEHDLAILSTEWSHTQPVATVRSERGTVGEDVFAIGNPLGFRYSYTRGYIGYSCREYESEDGVCWTQADLTVGPGSSGGGLYDAEGRLMGLCSHGFEGFAFNMFADSVALAKLVAAYK